MRIVALVGLGMSPKQVARISKKYPVEIAPSLVHEHHETLTNYAHRWADQLQLTSEDILIGFSFAGPIALEIASYKGSKGCILVSTFGSPSEMPSVHRKALQLGLHKWIPYSIGWKFGTWWAKRKGILTVQNKRSIHAIQRETPPEFYRWVLEELKNWEGAQPSCAVLRLHGTHDRIIPVSEGTPGVDFIPGNHFLLSSREALLLIQDKVDTFISNVAL